MIGSGHLSRLFHTVRHLRGEQIAYRLYYRLARPLVTRQALASITELSRRAWVRPWVAPLIAPRSHIDQGVFEFLGERGRVETAGDWNAVNKTKLWLYNLHYLDDLNAVDADARSDQQGWLIQRWIDDNPPLSAHHSVHIHMFSFNTAEHLSSWEIQLPFDFLPVYQVAKQLSDDTGFSLKQSAGLLNTEAKLNPKELSKELASDKVKVKLPNGKIGTIPRSNLQKALEKGAVEVK